MARTKVQIRDLTIDYVNEDLGERHRSIEALSLDVYENEFLCVVGPSGCGKSTLIAAIAGFLRPAAGELTMDGRRITGPGADRGVVFQEYALLPW
jgi:NitT/TauT family transport system ATP-binding protein